MFLKISKGRQPYIFPIFKKKIDEIRKTLVHGRERAPGFPKIHQCTKILPILLFEKFKEGFEARCEVCTLLNPQ